jgi:hypothetical protein
LLEDSRPGADIAYRATDNLLPLSCPRLAEKEEVCKRRGPCFPEEIKVASLWLQEVLGNLEGEAKFANVEKRDCSISLAHLCNMLIMLLTFSRLLEV